MSNGEKESEERWDGGVSGNSRSLKRRERKRDGWREERGEERGERGEREERERERKMVCEW